MAIHFYVQDRDLNDMMENWRENAHFKQFIDSFPQDAEYTADKLVNDFLKQAKLIHTKHFSQWRDKYLHLALGGDAIPVQCISNWLLGKEITPELPATYHSDTHKPPLIQRLATPFSPEINCQRHIPLNYFLIHTALPSKS